MSASAHDLKSIDFCLGMYPPPPGVTDVIGLECSGEIIEKGAEATMDWKVGDKAMTLLGGGGYGIHFSLYFPPFYFL